VKKPKLLLTGLSPDRLNSNRRIRSAIARGATDSALFDVVHDVPVELVTVNDAPSADVILAVGSAGSEEVNFHSLRRFARHHGSKLVFWTHEDPYEFDFNEKVVDIPDLFFTNEVATLEFYRHKNVQWLPLAGDLDYYRPIEDNVERYIDLFFCGYGYPIRRHILERIFELSKGNYFISAFGPNMGPQLEELVNKKSLQTQEMADYARSSILTLNIGRDQPIANSRLSIQPETPGPRTFDIALSGCVQTMFNDGVLIDCFYHVGDEMLLFDNAEDVLRQIDEFRGNADSIRRIAGACQKATMDAHLYKHRINKILECL
jgi:spore maturation protein CgeB